MYTGQPTLIHLEVLRLSEHGDLSNKTIYSHIMYSNDHGLLCTLLIYSVNQLLNRVILSATCSNLLGSLTVRSV